ncbi:MAG: uL15 family ribosomal protein, partial [Tepidimonas ignava]|nr:uL15 family ribosomal protein [Tepidimonas ignava]
SPTLKFNAEVTLADLQALGKSEVDMLTLKQAGLVPLLARKVKVIKTGELSIAVKLNGVAATAGAKAAIEAAGGSVA